MLLLNALALDLASAAVGTMVLLGIDVVEGVFLLLLYPVEEAMDDGVDNVVEDGELDGVEEGLEPLDPEVMLRVDDCMPPMPIALEFVPASEGTLELDGRLEFREAEGDDNKDLIDDAPPPVVKYVPVLPVWIMLFGDEDPETL